MVSSIKSIFSLILLVSINVYSQGYNFEIPAISKGEQIIHHHGYSLSYNEKHEQANWVAYELTTDKTVARYSRTNKFLIDPQVQTGSADNEDYEASGYDRGHLAPAADMEWSEESVKESFYYSNMSPQLPSFNRGIWKHLEEFVREAAINSEAIYVVTGPVLTDGLSTIGHNHVSVPKYYYKVLLDYKDPEKKGIAFILPNESSPLSLSNFAVTIDSVEKITHINFFPTLSSQDEASLEKEIDYKKWEKSSEQNHSSGHAQKQSNENEASEQCTALTKKGARCRNHTKNSKGRCYLHQ